MIVSGDIFDKQEKKHKTIKSLYLGATKDGLYCAMEEKDNEDHIKKAVSYDEHDLGNMICQIEEAIKDKETKTKGITMSPSCAKEILYYLKALKDSI